MYSTSRTSVTRSDASARSSTDTFVVSSPAGEHGLERKPMKREEMEVRRYTGKDSIEDYLQQFDLAARHNYWTDSEKASYLLCALDGSARGILSEIEDVFAASYKEVRGALLKRFGPIDLPAAHEQALHQLRLAPGQHIRELAQEVQRLTQRAYIDLAGRSRNQVMIGFFLRAIPDKDVVFYIRDKDPRDLGEACCLYERFRALSGAADQRPSTVRATSCEEKLEPALKSNDRLPTHITQNFMDRTSRRLDQIGYTLERRSATSPRETRAVTRSIAPRTPYHRYGQTGNIARDCDARWKEEPEPILRVQSAAASPMLPVVPAVASPLLPGQPTAESPLLPEQPTAESPLLPEQPAAESPLGELSPSDVEKLQWIDIDAASSICGSTSGAIDASKPAQRRDPAVYAQVRVYRKTRPESREQESCLWSSVRSVWSTAAMREGILPVRLFYGHLPRPPENRKCSTVPEEREGFAAGGASFPPPPGRGRVSQMLLL